MRRIRKRSSVTVGLVVAVTAALALVASGCGGGGGGGGSTAATTGSTTTIGKGEGSPTVIEWPLYTDKPWPKDARTYAAMVSMVDRHVGEFVALVRELGLPFRDAHHVTGAAVKLAEALGCDLPGLPLAELQNLEPRINDHVYEVLTPDASVASRKSYGGTAPDQVRAQIQRWKEILQ